MCFFFKYLKKIYIDDNCIEIYIHYNITNCKYNVTKYYDICKKNRKAPTSHAPLSSTLPI